MTEQPIRRRKRKKKMKVIADPHHLALLNEGVLAWNQWRQEHPEMLALLGEANLQGRDLRAADLSGAILQGANFRRAVLQGADLGGAFLQGAVLEGANLLTG